MKVSRQNRRSVALLTAALFFLCQTAFAAAACAHGGFVGGASAQTAESAPCHESMGDANHDIPQAPATHSMCDAPKAVSQAIQMQIVALADLPAIVLPALEPAASRVVALAPRAHRNPCTAPPFTLLHCRLLN